MLSGEELKIAQGILSGIQNATGYGYETMVKGTQISAAIDLIGIVISIVIGISIAYLGKKYIESKVLVNSRWLENNTPGKIPTIVICGVAGFFGILILYVIMSPAIIALMIPEYTVMNKIIEAMT